MPVAATFEIVVDSNVQDVAAQNQPTDRDFEFQIPSDWVVSPAILQFMAHPSREPSDNFQVEFSINGQFVYRYGPSSAKIVRCFQVVVGGRNFMRGGNILTIKRVEGTGTLGVSSVVIWVQRNIALPLAGKSATSKKAPTRTSRKPAKRPTKKSGKSARRSAR